MNPGQGAAASDVLLRRSLILRVVFVILGLLILSRLIETGVLSYQERTWERRVGDQSREYLVRAERSFTGIQRATRRLAAEIAANPAVLEYLGGALRDSTDLFTYISRMSRDQEVGIEVFDRSGGLAAWEGRSDAGHAREVQIALDGQLTSYVNSGPAYSFLFVATPVRSGGRVVGAVLVRQTIEVNYPLSNRFINREGLSIRLTEEFGVPVEFDFDPRAELRKDGRYSSAYLYGIDSSRVGVLSVLRPLRSSSLEGTSQLFRRINALLALLLTGFLLLVVLDRSRKAGSLLLRSALVTVAIWAARYLLLWLDIPSSLIPGGIFDPTSFASKFGGGLAKSIGEMSLTSLALLGNTTLVLQGVLDRIRRGLPWRYPDSVPLRLLTAVAATVLLFLLLRGFGATVRSAVVDSTLNFADPGVIIPSFDLGLMVVNLFIIDFCLIVAAVGLTSYLAMLFSPPGGGDRPHLLGWAVAALLFAAAAVLFGILQPNPLMSTPYRLLFGGGILAFTYHLHTLGGPPRLMTVRTLMLGLGLSTLFFYPLLQTNISERDRNRIEALSAEVLRPVDSWLTFVVEDLLARLASEETGEMLGRGRSDDLARLAFTRWAGSVASREGYSCRVMLADAGGRTLSQFTLGTQPQFDVSLILPPHLGAEKRVFVREIGSGITAVRLYAGSIPVGGGAAPAAWGIVVLSAGQQTFFRGENPAILRNVSKDDRDAISHDVVLSEYRDGMLFASSDPRLPLSHRLSDDALGGLRDSTVTSFWTEEDIDGSTFDVLLARRGGSSTEVIALGVKRGGFQWHLLSIVKMMFYYGLVAAVLLVVLFLVRRARGRRYVPTFRDRLLGALLFTAIVPMVVLAVYGRIMARERVLEATGRLLEQETAAVSAALIQRGGWTENGSPSGPLSAIAAELAADLGTDFNVYVGNRLVASSRPELFETGILDTRMSGSAFAGIFRQGRRFHLETERIGLYQYAVGYAPLLDDRNSPVGVVSVPTLYHQEEIDRETSQRNALLFGLYALVLLGIVGIATTFANRIAAPIHGLTQATQRVSEGELAVTVGVPRADGEIGELIRSFETMTRDLQRSRDELVRYEREKAWKEMARQVAHEIKNPLTPMKLSLQHLQQTYRDRVPDFGKIFDEVSRTIIDQIDALSRIASEFSHFARMPNPRKEQCALNAVVQESVQLFEREGAVVFETSYAPDLPEVIADREELRRALINILRNAIQAMGGQGTVKVATGRSRAGLTIMVKDTGPGMSEEIRVRLFEPNFSTKTDGMGLGLAIVKKTIDDLGGTIGIESGVGEGTTVTMTLPVPGDQGMSTGGGGQ